MRFLPEGWGRTVLMLGAAAVLGGGLLVVSGVVPIKASAGHWPTTRWLLSFTRARSVWTHSRGIEVPELEDLRLIARGASHFETACRVCHGAPGHDRAVTMSGLTPEPPHLETLVPDRGPRELFHVVKHGIKMTAMPAWPALEREDEVWAMVAFLRQLPAMDSMTYHRLSRGDAEEEGPARESPPDAATDAPPDGFAAAIPAVVESRCVRCHGRDGRGRDGAFPRLAGQKRPYLEMALEAYALRLRYSGIMQAVVADADADELAAAARYYSGLPPAAARPDEPHPAPAGVVERGELIAHEGIPEEKVPTCVSCHGPDSEREPNERYPHLAGQHPEYLAQQLELFREGRRGATLYAHVMELSAEGLTAEDVRAVSAYYASLEP